LTLRVPPEVKALLAAAAEADRRSLANMLEVIVYEYCERQGITAKAAPSKMGAA
jgi:predicted HicB family RNase H-like nuclease